MAEDKKATDYTHRYVGNHPQEFVFGESSLMLGPGDFVTLDAEALEDPVYKEMVETGVLLDLKGGEAK